jgi:L-ascorbate metabolism protein UlaG (beta-lactamase superfamily)
MPKLLFQGHGSYRLTTDDGRVIYVDPYAGAGYEKPADLILITHQHSDHNKTSLCARKENCEIISNVEALAGGTHQRFDLEGIIIQAVEAKNLMHNPKKCVGFLITIDGVKIYASGDTSTTRQMASFAELELDYALFCGDGFANMNPKEAAKCAELVGAKHNILIHTRPGKLVNPKAVDEWAAPNKLIIEPGEEIELA